MPWKIKSKKKKNYFYLSTSKHFEKVGKKERFEKETIKPHCDRKVFCNIGNIFYEIIYGFIQFLEV